MKTQSATGYLFVLLLMSVAVSGQWIFPDENNNRQKPTQAPATPPPNQGGNNQVPDNQNPPVGPLNPPNPSSVVNTVPCPCAFAAVFNPVCGTNGVSYFNQRVLECHRECGVDVSLRRLGVCEGRGQKITPQRT